MAGIGSIPSTIYLQPDRRWELLGQALGALGGNTLQGYQQSQALTQSANMPPEQKAEFLMQKLGPKGADFVKNLLQIQQAQSNIKQSDADTARAVADTAHAQLGSKLLENQLAHADEEREMKMKLDQAEIAERRASAAGAGAMASYHSAEAAKAREELGQIQQKRALTGIFMNRILKDQTGDEGDSSGGTQTPSSQTPRVQPQSYTGPTPQPEPISGDTSQARFQPIAETTQAPSETDSPTGEESNPVEKKLALIHAFEKYGDPTTGQALKPIKLTPGQKDEINFLGAGGDFAGALKAQNQFNQPNKYEKQPLLGGFEAEFAYFPNGTRQMVPGSLVDNRKPADQSLRTTSGGAVLWSQTNDILKSLSGVNPDDAGSDVLGNAARRRGNALLQRMGFQPTGSDEDRSFRESYTAMSQHNVFALRTLLGNKAAQQLVNQLQDMSAKPTDTKEIRDTKFKATELTAETYIKNEVETTIENDQKVPPALLQVYEQKGLNRRSMQDLKQQYLSTFKKLGMKAPPLPGDESANSDRAGTANSSGADTGGDTVTIGGKSYSRSAAESVAKQNGISLEDLVSGQ